MAFCGNCGSKIEEGAKFCPSCGAPAQAQNTQNTAQVEPVQTPVNYDTPVSGPVTAAAGNSAEAADAQNNKVMAILAYFGPLVLIPIFAAKTSAFARYHSNQGLVLFIVTVAYSIVSGILNSLILAISWRLYFLTSIISMVGIVFTVLAIIGVVNAYKGEKKPLPVIGGINILK